jgi:hypothetical protein
MPNLYYSGVENPAPREHLLTPEAIPEGLVNLTPSDYTLVGDPGSESQLYIQLDDPRLKLAYMTNRHGDGQGVCFKRPGLAGWFFPQVASLGNCCGMYFVDSQNKLWLARSDGTNARWTDFGPCNDPVTGRQLGREAYDDGRYVNEMVGGARTMRLCSAATHRAAVICAGCNGRFAANAISENGCCSRCENGIDTNYRVNRAPAAPIQGGSYDLITSKRRFGIELEMAEAPGFRKLLNDDGWGAHHDGSVPEGVELVSPVMRGDQGLARIERLANLATERRWKVDKRCGYHLHLDVSQDTPLAALRIIKGYCLLSPLFTVLVSKCRMNDRYGARYAQEWNRDEVKHIKAAADVKGFQNLLYALLPNRYRLLNVQAYKEHGTLEVRIHHGTCMADKITNWILLHSKLFDYCRKEKEATLTKKIRLPIGASAAQSAAEIWRHVAPVLDSSELVSFYKERAMTLHGIDLDSGSQVSTPKEDPELATTPRD